MSELKIWVLDVGHGDFIYAETPFGDRLVIDCGSGDVVPSEFLSKVSTIHELQISHPHEDHFSDLPALAKKSILSFLCPETDVFSDEKIAWRTHDKTKVAILRNLQRNLPWNGAAVSIGQQFSRSVWTPPEHAIDYDDPNTVSLVTILSHGSFKMLFGGDLTETGWDALLSDPRFVAAIADTTIYKVAHHGRREGCSDGLFKKIKPTLCVVSDKMIDSTNENTECIQWYRDRVTGCEFIFPDGSRKVRKVLTTRKDGSIFVGADPLTWYCKTHTNSK